MHSRWRFGSGVALAVLILIALAFRGGSEEPHALSSPILERISVGEAALASSSTPVSHSIKQPIAVILPHHQAARSLIAELLASFGAVHPYTIVILGPDHQNLGSAFATTSTSDWTWQGRRLRLDHEMVAELISPSCTASDALIESEHSVLVPMPFLAERFPNARFIPLALRGGWNASAISALAERLDELLAPDDLVVASVDFSHALPLASAEQEDVLSRQLLESGDPNALSAVRADSPEALAVAMRFAQLRRAGSISILRHANSAELLDARDAQNTTSYFTAAFAQ